MNPLIGFLSPHATPSIHDSLANPRKTVEDMEPHKKCPKMTNDHSARKPPDPNPKTKTYVEMVMGNDQEEQVGWKL